MLFHFFRYLNHSVFHNTFVKKFMKKLSFFNSNFKIIVSWCILFQDGVYCRKLGCQTFWFWNTLWIQGKKLKKLSILGAVFSEIKNPDILNFSWIKYFGKDFSFLIKWHIWSTIVEITSRRTWKQNWKQNFDCKLVFILSKKLSKTWFWTVISDK